jgi:ABC-2 type transport system ATP-binding protein
MDPIIEAHDLHKHFGDVHALDGLDLTAESGRVTALLGPNGAAVGIGHTTTYWVSLSIAWCIGILVVFSALATRQFAKPD